MTEIAIGIGCLLIGWHLSGWHHERRWARDIYRKAEKMASGVYQHPEVRELVHQDQECGRLVEPLPPLSIKAISLDLHCGLRHRSYHGAGR